MPETARKRTRREMGGVCGELFSIVGLQIRRKFSSRSVFESELSPRIGANIAAAVLSMLGTRVGGPLVSRTGESTWANSAATQLN